MVGISILAPFAVIDFDELEVFEGGGRSEPDVEPHVLGLDWKKLDMEEHYLEVFSDEEMAPLRKLRLEIAGILKQFDLTVLAEKDLDRPVPWLRAGARVSVQNALDPITVRQAFFVKGISED